MPEFARFDRRHYPTVGVREGYRDWTPSYEETVEDAMDLALLERIAGVRWSALESVADLGCGTGRTGAWLAARGARGLDGVDLTPEMLARARDKGVYARLLEADVRASGLGDAAYELAVSCLVDEHLPELAPLYAEARRLLRPGGAFVLVGYHPFFSMGAGMPTHFEGARGPVAVETHVHLFGEHFGAARGAGFVAEELHESVVDDEWIRLKPRWEAWRDWPISFAWLWRIPRARGGAESRDY